MRILGMIIAVVLAVMPPLDAGDRGMIQVEQEIIEPTEYTLFGTCTISHYCNCSACCGVWAGGGTASGTIPTSGRTVANNVLPYGTKVLIDGQEYVVEDCGGSIMDSGMWFDVYCDSHAEALQRGLYQTDVYIVEDNNNEN